jgi:hypothetical protein
VMRGRYGLLFAVVAGAMLSMAGGAGFFMNFAPLPDPSVATRQQVFRWLVLRDLGKESVQIRQKILDRVDSEFENPVDLDSTIAELDGTRRQMLWHNVNVLLEPWLLGRVQQYSQLPAGKKVEYIDAFLDRVALWDKVGSACLKNSAGAGQEGNSSASTLMMEQVRQCSNHCDPEQRRQIGVFLAAVQSRWLWRQLPSFNLFGKPARLAK